MSSGFRDDVAVDTMLSAVCPSSSSCGHAPLFLCPHQEEIATKVNGDVDTEGQTGFIVVEVVHSKAAASVQATHRLNVIGFFCPVPVAEAKRAFATMTPGQVLELLADDPEVMHDLPMLIDRSGHRLISIEQNAGEYCFLVEVA